MPETSATEKIKFERSLVIENNCPAEPSNESVPFDAGYTNSDTSVFTVTLAPENTICGSLVLPILGVITMFLYVFAITVFISCSDHEGH